MSQKLHILLAISHNLMRAGLHQQLLGLAFIAQIEYASTLDELHEKLQAYPINFIILHQAFYKMAPFLPPRPFIVLGDTYELQVQLEITRSDKCCGYLSDNIPYNLLSLICSMLVGDGQKCCWIASLFTPALQSADAKQWDGMETLTSRELMIINLYQQGLGSREIAQQLYITSDTVRKHKSNICRKLGISWGQLMHHNHTIS